ncbi:olfactory receptor 7E178-like [Oryctolagus cuniculus]|uniref:olfactory receptor 7E178-like n=1 Tax=Oryctolagus cuniculus TaxID=9986 RepID=UPI003879E58C
MTQVSEFHLTGFSEDPALQPLFFGLFLSMYLSTVLGNLLISLANSSDSHLHTPMYFFLCNLSLAHIGFTYSMIPKMIVDIHTHSTAISYVGCLTQMNLYHLWMHGCFASDHDGLWLVCHHLSSTALTGHHEPLPLWLRSFQVLCGQPFGIPAAECDGVPDISFRVWLSSCIKSYLFGILFMTAANASLNCSLNTQKHDHKGDDEDTREHNMLYLTWQSGGISNEDLCYTFSRPSHGSQYLAVSSVALTHWCFLEDPFQESPTELDHRIARVCISVKDTWILRSTGSVETQNWTCVPEFHLVGFSEDPELQSLLLVLFLSVYLVTVLGNLLIILLIISDTHLHTPMYFFLCNLSLADMGFTSTTVPKMIVDIHTHSTVISYVGCLTQMSLFIIFGCMDDLILTVMAYDRFVAICHPLHYQVIMNPHRCGFLVSVSFFGSLLESLLHNLILLPVTCFKAVEISNFFCDPSQLLNLTCDDTFNHDIVMYLIGIVFGFFPISGILFSYYKIVSSILRVPSPDGKYKAFSTCGSHLLVVCLFYGSGLGVYLSASFSTSSRKSAVASLMYTMVTPMLNPFIYSLRNRDIKRALQRIVNRIS